MIVWVHQGWEVCWNDYILSKLYARVINAFHFKSEWLGIRDERVLSFWVFMFLFLWLVLFVSSYCQCYVLSEEYSRWLHFSLLIWSKRWVIEVNGAPGTLYANETYQLQVDFPEHYPMEAPQVGTLVMPLDYYIDYAIYIQGLKLVIYVMIELLNWSWMGCLNNRLYFCIQLLCILIFIAMGTFA